MSVLERFCLYKTVILTPLPQIEQAAGTNRRFYWLCQDGGQDLEDINNNQNVDDSAFYF